MNEEQGPVGEGGGRPGRRLYPYREAAVVAVGLALLVVPLLAATGHNRMAVLWLAGLLAVLGLVRIQRPDGTWVQARGRVFDVVMGLGLAAVLVALAYYATLPSVL